METFNTEVKDDLLKKIYRLALMQIESLGDDHREWSSHDILQSLEILIGDCDMDVKKAGWVDDIYELVHRFKLIDIMRKEL